MPLSSLHSTGHNQGWDVLQEPCLRDEPLIHNCKGHGLGQCRASGDLGFLVREEANGLLV